MCAYWCDQLNGCVNKLARRKLFLVTKIPLWEYWCVPQGSFAWLSFYGVLPVFSWFQKIFTCPYLGVPYFGRSPVFRKWIILDTALFVFGRLVLQWGHTRAIIQYYGGLRQRIHEKSSLQIICSNRRNSYSVYVTDALGKAKGNIKHLMRK